MVCFFGEKGRERNEKIFFLFGWLIKLFGSKKQKLFNCVAQWS